MFLALTNNKATAVTKCPSKPAAVEGKVSLSIAPAAVEGNVSLSIAPAATPSDQNESVLHDGIPVIDINCINTEPESFSSSKPMSSLTSSQELSQSSESKTEEILSNAPSQQEPRAKADHLLKKPFEYYLRWDLSDAELQQLKYSEKARRYHLLTNPPNMMFDENHKHLSISSEELIEAASFDPSQSRNLELAEKPFKQTLELVAIEQPIISSLMLAETAHVSHLTASDLPPENLNAKAERLEHPSEPPEQTNTNFSSFKGTPSEDKSISLHCLDHGRQFIVYEDPNYRRELDTMESHVIDYYDHYWYNGYSINPFEYSIQLKASGIEYEEIILERIIDSKPNEIKEKVPIYYDQAILINNIYPLKYFAINPFTNVQINSLLRNYIKNA